jgi:hypothetical protein
MMGAMSTQTLHEALARLHTELQGATQLDPESSQLLKSIAADVERLRGNAVSPGDSPHVSRLESLAVRFEAGHPALAASLREIADALGRVGV